MKVISLDEYRRAKRIQEVPEKQKNVGSTREKLVNQLSEKLRQRLRMRMSLINSQTKSSKPNIPNLPKNYKCSSTQELLKMWEQLKNEGLPEDTLREKIVAMGKFLNEYKISPESRA